MECENLLECQWIAPSFPSSRKSGLEISYPYILIRLNQYACSVVIHYAGQKVDRPRNKYGKIEIGNGGRVGSVVRALDWIYPKVEGSNPVRSTRNQNFELCWKGYADSLSVCPTPSVYTHASERPCTHVKDPVVIVRIRWIMETWK